MVENYLSIRQSPETFKKIFERGKLLHRKVEVILGSEVIFSAYSVGRKYYITFGSTPLNQCLYEYKGFKNSEDFLRKVWDSFSNDKILEMRLMVPPGEYSTDDLDLPQKIIIESIVRYLDRGWCFEHELSAQLDTLKYTHEILRDGTPICVDDNGDFYWGEE